MDRRSFLRWLGGTTAGAALAPSLDLDRLLWVPGEKTIFLPPDVHENVFACVDWITKEALRLLEGNLTVTKAFDTNYNAGFSARFDVPLPVFRVAR